MLQQIAIGLGAGIVAALIGHRTRFLSTSGALSVALVCAMVFGATTWVWGVLIVVMFLTTNLWTLYGAQAKRELGLRFQAGSTRGADQIIARVGWGTLMALVYASLVGGKSPVLVAAYVGALAASTADAWATEIGALARDEPISLVRRIRVRAGSPGAISPLGLVAATLGAWLQGLTMLLGASVRAAIDSVPREANLALLPLAATLGGLAGCLVDSLLGATAQAVYYCEACDELCETREHSCGNTAEQVRGWRWLTNDAINLVGSIVGAAVTVVLYVWLARFRAGW